MRISVIRKLAWIYGGMFFAIVALNYIPLIHDAAGNMFGLFKLDPIDDVVHMATAIWAGIAAWHSTKQSVLFFKVFGIFYFTDGVICWIFGQCLADFTLFTHFEYIALLDASSFMERFYLNIPHVIIGGAAILIGFYLSKKINTVAS